MHKMDVTSAIKPAFQHMSRILFQQFSFKKWLGLGLIAMFLGSGNNGNFRVPGDSSQGSSPQIGEWFAHYWPFLILAAIAFMALGLLFSWISSVFHFVFIDDIARNSGAVKEPFSRMKGIGTSLFLWQLGVGIATLLTLAIFIGAPLVAAFTIGKDIVALQILAVVWSVMLLFLVIFAVALLQRLTIDFVTVAMYVRGIGILRAWKEITPVLKANAGQILLYFLITIAMGIGTIIPLMMIAGFVFLLLAIPFGGLAAIAYFIGDGLGMTWSAPVIAVAVVYGTAALMAFAYAVTCATLPVPVFMRSYSMVIIGQADPSLATINPETSAQQ